MRQMIKEMEEKPIESQGEDRLEMHDLSPKERRQKKKEKLKKDMEGMTGIEKASHLVRYFKWPVIITVALIIIGVSIGMTIYSNSRPTAMSYAIVNAADPDAVNVDTFTPYLEKYNLTKGYRVYGSTGIHLDPVNYEKEFDEDPNGTDYQSFPMMCFNNYYDIVISDEDGITYSAMQSIIHEADSFLDKELYEACKDRILYKTDYYGDEKPFAVDISDTEFAKSLNVGYDKVYLAFPGVSESNEHNAKQFLRYVLSLE